LRIINCLYFRFGLIDDINMKLYFQLFITAFFIFGLCSGAFAQRSNGLTVEGTVSVEEGSVEGAVIQMYRDGVRLDNYGIGSDGHYKVELNYGHEFTLIFYREDNFPQKIVVNTNVPRQVLQSDPIFPPFPVNINLFTEIPGIDRTFSENTVLKIYYSENIDNFISDLYYNDAQIKHLIDQAILQSQMIDQEADYLANLTKAELAELRKEYDQLLKEAEDEYKKEQFLAALDGYKAASKIFPKEQYPKDRIAEINDLLGMIMVAGEMERALAERLETLIKQGDLQLERNQLEEARNSYQRALSVSPGHQYAAQKVEEINQILKERRIDQEYENLIAGADNSFKELLYAEAEKGYQQALQLKPGESYPQQKIEEIKNIREQQAIDAEKQKNYQESLFQAELMFEKQFYEKAISFYENALTYKPGDSLATNKIREIRDLMNEFANRTLYDKLIETADKAFNKERYEEALPDYEQASGIFPDELHPRSRIEEINKILDREKNFNRLISQADLAFEDKKYIDSRDLYISALKIHSEDEHAKKRIEEIGSILAQRKLNERNDSLYAAAVTRGDDLFDEKSYEESRNAYRSALQVKPEESYPQERINEIADLLAQLAAAQEAYEKAVALGDRELGREAFDEARLAYQSALEAKPDEAYPKEKLAEIDSIVTTRARLAAEAEAAEQARLAAIQAEKDSLYAAEQARLAAIQAEKDSLYAAAVTRGDDLFDEKSYEESRTAYRSALQVKPEESYPQERINEISKILQEMELARSEQERIERNYQNAIRLADQQYNIQNFLQSKTNYEKAGNLKPEENYPEERIAVIDSILRSRELDENYRTIILAADGLFMTESYQEARSKYENALELKPDEKYPKDQIGKIDDILRKEQELALAGQQNDPVTMNENPAMPPEQESQEIEIMSEAGLNKLYDQYIATADGHFDKKQYNVSRAWYYRAWDLKPGETYPPQRIDEINRLVKSLLSSQRDRDYQRFIDLADSTFRTNQLAVARGWYNRALSVKEDENYPKDQLDAIAELIVERIAGQSGQLFESHINKGEEAFKNENYNVARFWYRKALELRPNDENAIRQIGEIEQRVK
jgi:tetratricopeptide (TPR) repeat protein